MTYIQSRFVVYGITILILLAFKPKLDRLNTLILVFLGLNILVDILDQTIISSNLELYIIYRILVMIILINMVEYSKRRRKYLYLIPALQCVFFLFFAITERNINYFNAPLIYTSNYGLINTSQYNFLMINFYFVYTALMFYWLYTIISTEKHTSGYVKKQLLVVFTFLWTSSIYLMFYIYIQLLFVDTLGYMKTAQVVLMISFYGQQLFLLIALQWKALQS